MFIFWMVSELFLNRVIIVHCSTFVRNSLSNTRYFDTRKERSKSIVQLTVFVKYTFYNPGIWIKTAVHNLALKAITNIRMHMSMLFGTPVYLNYGRTVSTIAFSERSMTWYWRRTSPSFRAGDDFSVAILKTRTNTLYYQKHVILLYIYMYIYVHV